MDKKKIQGLVGSIPSNLDAFDKEQLIEIIERLKKTLVEWGSEDKKGNIEFVLN